MNRIRAIIAAALGPQLALPLLAGCFAAVPGSSELSSGNGPGYSSQSCPACENNAPIMPGHGPASSSDNRRIISIAIDPSWNSSPGNTNALIWNAVACAVQSWNNARDPYGNATPYYFKVDQSGQYGKPADITFTKGSIPSQAGTGHLRPVRLTEGHPT